MKPTIKELLAAIRKYGARAKCICFDFTHRKNGSEMHERLCIDVLEERIEQLQAEITELKHTVEGLMP
jgi:hypothetical protein